MNRQAAVNEAVIRLNHASPVPGLGINLDAGSLYYRMSPTTAPEGGIRPAKIRTVFRHTLNQAAALHRIMQSVIDGRTAPEDVVGHYNRAGADSTSIPPGKYTVNLEGQDWALTFDEDGTVHLFRGEEKVVESSSMTEESRVTFIDRSGGFKVSEPGIYQWRYEDGNLEFRLVNDSSKGRETILTSAAWQLSQ